MKVREIEQVYKKKEKKLFVKLSRLDILQLLKPQPYLRCTPSCRLHLLCPPVNTKHLVMSHTQIYTGCMEYCLGMQEAGR